MMKTKINILIIDDDPDTRHFISNVLEAEGFLALSAETAEKGLDMALNLDPCAVILNIALPDHAGVTIYRNMKKIEKLKDIPVILESSLTERTFSRWRDSAGFPRDAESDDKLIYFEKPLEADVIIRLIRKIVSERIEPNEQDNKTDPVLPKPFSCPAKKRGCSCP